MNIEIYTTVKVLLIRVIDSIPKDSCRKLRAAKEKKESYKINKSFNKNILLIDSLGRIMLQR